MMAKTNKPGKFRVDFEPVGRRVEVESGTTLLAAAQKAGVELVAVCGGMGLCSDCRVRLVSGDVSAYTDLEKEVYSSGEIADGYRMACQTEVFGDVKVDIPVESLMTPQRLQIEGLGTELVIDPPVVAIDMELSEEIFAKPGTILAQLTAKTGYSLKSMDEGLLPVIRGFTEQAGGPTMRLRFVLRGEQLVTVLPAEERILGLAVDLGTTKLAGYLLDLETGELLAKSGVMNPQIRYGEDVVSRIVYANQGEEQAKELQSVVVETLNEMIAGLCQEAGYKSDHVVELAFAGNTAMHHLLLNLPTKQLAVLPFDPAVSDSITMPAKELGIQAAQRSTLYLPPNIAGYIGGDHVAVILAHELRRTDRMIMAVDVGTNTEISLAVGGHLLSCSCASGPAFEGAHIQEGMRAAAGAIERVQIIDGEVRTQAIGGDKPVGICGTGILDAVAEMHAAGILESSGRMIADHPRVQIVENGMREFILVPKIETGHGRDIVITQNDVREIQLAKSAIQVGIRILLSEAGVEPDELDAFIIAGAFGTYLDLNSTTGIKMFPALPSEKFQQVGNAAGVGIQQMLLSVQAREGAADIREKVQHINLASHPHFTEWLMQAMAL